jgi:hypothetical protein
VADCGEYCQAAGTITQGLKRPSSPTRAEQVVSRARNKLRTRGDE